MFLSGTRLEPERAGMRAIMVGLCGIFPTLLQVDWVDVDVNVLHGRIHVQCLGARFACAVA